MIFSQRKYNRLLQHRSRNLLSPKPRLSLRFHFSLSGGFIEHVTHSGRDHGLVKEKVSNFAEIADNVVAILRHAEEPNEKLTKGLNDAVSSVGWTGLLADSILQTLEMTLWEDCDTLGPVLSRSYDDVAGEAKTKFPLLCPLTKAHPGGTPAAVLLTVLALGVLAELAPKVVELLELGRLGSILAPTPCACMEEQAGANHTGLLTVNRIEPGGKQL